MNRRTFLKAAGLSVAVTPLSALAIDPLPRDGAGPLKLSLSAYSMRQYLKAAAAAEGAAAEGREADGPDADGAIDLLGFVEYCRSLGVPGAELTSYYFPPGFAASPDEEHVSDVAYLAGLKRHCHVAGVSISGGAIRNDFCVRTEDVGVQLDHFRRWADVYDILGAPAIRVFGGNVPKGDGLDETVERCVAALTEAADYAGRRGVWVALENHGGITADPEVMLRLIRGVQADWFGVNFDSGNFATEDPFEGLAKIAPYAVNAQIKVEMRRPDGSKHAADLERVIKTLRDAGYGGWVALEYEAAEDPREAIPRWLDTLRPLLDAE